jgi:hypothetical protein
MVAMTLPRLTTACLFQSALLPDVDDATQSCGAYARPIATRKEIAWPNGDGSRKHAPFLGGC